MLIPALTLISVMFQAAPALAPVAPAPPTPAVTSQPATAAPGEVTPKPASIWGGRPRTRSVFVSDPDTAQVETQKPAPPADDGKQRCRPIDGGFVCGDSEDGMRQVEDMLRTLPR